METEELENMLTADQAASLMGVTANMVRYLCRAGRLEGAAKIGRIWFVPIAATKKVVRLKPGRKKEE